MWHGFSEIKSKIKNELKNYDKEYIDFTNDIFENKKFDKDNIDIFIEKLKGLNESIKQILASEETDKNEALLEKLEEKTIVLLDKIEILIYIDAYLIFRHLEANKWYFISDNEVNIKFLADDYESKVLKCNSVLEIIEDDKEVDLTNRIESKINVKYSWARLFELKGKVICNNMLIPSDYEYNCDLIKIFKEKPLLFIKEHKNDKLEIDLAREKCKLVSNNVNLEQKILEEIMLDEIKKNNNSKLNEIKKIFFKSNEERKIYFKNRYAIENIISDKTKMKYRIVLLKNTEKDNIDAFMDQVDDECIYEIINSNLIINTTFNDKKGNDLYLAARYGFNIYFRENYYDEIIEFSTTHLKAIVLSASNFLVYVDVNTDNQLKLNTNSLSDYRKDDTYKEKISSSLKANTNSVFCLKYNSIEEYREIKFSDNIQAIIEFNICKENYSKIFEAISLVDNSRRSMWNGFQEGVYSTNIENQKLRDILIKGTDIDE